MAIVDPGGLTLASQVAKKQPAERKSSGFFGWGGFVNFYEDRLGITADDVQNLINVVRVTGLGQDRSEYPTGAPRDDAESFDLGRITAHPVQVECLLSRRGPGPPYTDDDDSHKLMMDAADVNTKFNFVIGLGDNERLFAFTARVRTYTIDASLDAPVVLQLALRPSGKLTRLDPL